MAENVKLSVMIFGWTNENDEQRRSEDFFTLDGTVAFFAREARVYFLTAPSIFAFNLGRLGR